MYIAYFLIKAFYSMTKIPFNKIDQICAFEWLDQW